MRKHVCVFVAIHMGEADTASLDLADLGFHFALDFFRCHLLADCGDSKLLQARPKSFRTIC